MFDLKTGPTLSLDAHDIWRATQLNIADDQIFRHQHKGLWF
jgi:hypothetical protein